MSCPLPRIRPGIPCELAALARVPLRFTKGTFAPRPPDPLWIPAFAGMTVAFAGMTS